MKKILFNFILIFLFSFSYADDYFVKNGSVFDNNQNIVILGYYEYFKELPNAKTVKYIFRSEKDWGIYTFYFFDSNGKQVKKLVLESGYEFPALSFSPDEKYFILDAGTSPFRLSEIYEYNTLKKVKTLETLREGFWFNNKYYYNSVTEEGERNYLDEVHNLESFISCYNPETQEIEEITKCFEKKCTYLSSFTDKSITLYYKYYDKDEPYDEHFPFAIKEISFNLLDCSFKKAIVNDNSVRIRSDSNTNSKIITVLNKNAPVRIFSRTEIKYKADNLLDYWYLIQDKDCNLGFIYGAYLDIKE